MAFDVLLVDDSATVRAVIVKTLALAGIPVNNLYHAANGKEALETLADHGVDLIFSDINMPVMGGVEMIEKISRDERLRAVPLVVITTEGNTTRIDDLKEKGVKAYLRKPFTPESLREVVNDVMEMNDEE